MEPNAASRRDFLAVLAAAAAAGPAIAQSSDPARWTLKQASDQLRRKAVSPVDLTEACNNRIERYGYSLGAFISVTREQALRTAREMAAEQQRGKWRGP